MRTKTVLPLIIILLCVAVMWGVYGNFMSKHDTVTASIMTVEDVVETTALVIRDEYPVMVGDDGFFQNIVPNYSRVSRGHTLGSYYVGEYDKTVASELSMVNERLREAELSKTSSETHINDISAIENRISEYTEGLSALSAQGDMKSINKIRRETDNLLLRKKSISEGTGSSAEQTIISLNQQRTDLESKLGSNKSSIYSSAAGVFIIGADGYEEKLKPDSMDTYTPEFIKQTISDSGSEPDETVYPRPIARVVDNSKWHIALVCDDEHAMQLDEGDRVGIRVKSETSEDIICTVEKIGDSSDDECVVILTGTVELYYIYSSRVLDIELVVNEYTGLRVPKAAVINDYGKDVVEVVSGTTVTRKPVEVLYSNDEIAVIKEDNTVEGGLRLYDEVIINEHE